jgi:hypothetical protein
MTSFAVPVAILSIVAAAALCCAIRNYRKIRDMTEEIQRIRESQSDLERDSDCQLFSMMTRSFKNESDQTKEISDLSDRITALEGDRSRAKTQTKVQAAVQPE